MQKTKNNILFSQFTGIIYYAAKTAVQKTRSDYNKNNYYYLFVMDKAENESLNGLMPFNRHFGFIFTGDKPTETMLFRTIAHELGHWLNLKHTFEEELTYKSYTKPPIGTDPTKSDILGKTDDNFMDYNIKRERWFRFQLLIYKR